MKISETETGFSLASGEVRFSFVSPCLPQVRDSLAELTLAGDVPVPQILPGDRLLLPVDEGLALTAEKNYEPGQFSCDFVGGPFCSREGTMSMVIVEREGKYLLIALDHGIHSEYGAQKEGGLYRLRIQNHKPVRVRYGLFDSLPAACRRYRETRARQPLSLSEKLARNPDIAALTGGGIFWVWNDRYDEVMYSDTDTEVSPLVGDALTEIAGRLHRGGVDRAMFGIFFDGDSPAAAPLFQNYGYLCTQYDNYNDVLDPALLGIIPGNRVRNCGYTARRMADYPDGVLVTEEGTLAPAWELKGFDGRFHSQNTLCPQVAAERMKAEIPEILKKFPAYRGRFIDVYGGGLCECHSPDHPLSREECLAVKRDAFSALADLGLIAGTEDGFEELLDALVYTEGLHSPVHFRNADSGRRHAHVYTDGEAAHLRKQMLSPDCRVPLWQLVYHDSLLAFPYWGDSTECSPGELREKILFACLYGCPPLYSFFAGDFARLEDSILTSYRKITACTRKTATLPMTDFRTLRRGDTVQMSVFGDRYAVVANFSDREFTFRGRTVPPRDVIMEELEA